MSVSERNMAPIWTDPDDAPDMSGDEWFGKATLYVGDKPVRQLGRPRGSDKESVTIRLDKAALDHFRAGGPGWQTRINAAVRKAAGL